MSSDTNEEADTPPSKPGFLRRLFGGLSGGAEVPPEPASEPDQTDVLPEAHRSEAEAVPQHDPTVAAEVDPDNPPAPLLEAAEPIEARAGLPDAVLAEALAPLPDIEALAQPGGAPQVEPESDEQPRSSWWNRLKQGLARSSSSISQGIIDVFAKRKLDAATLEDLEEILIRADLGVTMATRIAAAVGKGRFDKAIDPEEVKAVLAEEVEATLLPVAKPLTIEPGRRPFTILVVGVNGSGKTTTIGKLAAKLSASGHSVMLAAGDTFRAAAIEQLRVWGGRVGVPVVARDQGGDAAGLAFDAVKQAQAAGTEVLLIDTAGRLQNRTELMDELAKVIRVVRKLDADAPHAVLLVLDATVGQNAINQVEIFARVAGVTGLIMTKLDGTARGGILVAIAEKFGLPVHFIGVGEGMDDLEPFEARDFARAIAGLGNDD